VITCFLGTLLIWLLAWLNIGGGIGLLVALSLLFSFPLLLLVSVMEYSAEEPHRAMVGLGIGFGPLFLVLLIDWLR
jgi:hypothetical protein